LRRERRTGKPRHRATLANALTFPSPPVTMVALQASISDYLVKLTARESGAKSDTVAFNVARNELEGDLGDNGNYVNIVAGGSLVTVDLSGYPYYNTTSVPDFSPPAAPTDVRVRQGDLSGQIVVRYKPSRARSMNEVEICTADPNVEANWHDAGTFSGGKATITGLTPGTTVWVRIRTLGLQNVKGAWSDPAKIMVV
jgi:hypothetical protein